MNRHVLTCNFITTAELTSQLRLLLGQIIEKNLSDIDHIWLTLEQTQGLPPDDDEPRSIILQCNFYSLIDLMEFRKKLLNDAIEIVKSKMPDTQCMVFETILKQISL